MDEGLTPCRSVPHVTSRHREALSHTGRPVDCRQSRAQCACCGKQFEEDGRWSDGCQVRCAQGELIQVAAEESNVRARLWMTCASIVACCN
jgi:hypothetical protein